MRPVCPPARGGKKPVQKKCKKTVALFFAPHIMPGMSTNTATAPAPAAPAPRNAWNPATDNDLDCFGGAENFRNGDRPLVREVSAPAQVPPPYGDVLYIACANEDGFRVEGHIQGPEGLAFFVQMPLRPRTAAEACAILHTLLLPRTEDAFVAAGWNEM